MALAGFGRLGTKQQQYVFRCLGGHKYNEAGRTAAATGCAPRAGSLRMLALAPLSGAVQPASQVDAFRAAQCCLSVALAGSSAASAREPLGLAPAMSVIMATYRPL